MKYGLISIYYSENFGYIIASYTTLKGSVAKVVMNPVNVIEIGTSEEKLGFAIKEALGKSCESSPIDHNEVKDFKFWKIAGIKGFSVFSKKFQCIDLTQKESCYELIELIRENDGSFVEPTNNKPKQLPLTASEKQIGMTVKQMVSDKDKRENDSIFSFRTLNENTITYTRPADDFEDMGDGHTDAYQIFNHEAYNKNYIAFLIDNKYSEISEEGIKSRWNLLYGELLDYQYEEINNKQLKIITRAISKEVELKSYFYQDGEDLLEVLTEIDIVDTPKELQKEINKELEKVIDSIKIK